MSTWGYCRASSCKELGYRRRRTRCTRGDKSRPDFENKKSWRRECTGTSFCWTKLHSGYENKKSRGRDCQGSSLCWKKIHRLRRSASGRSGYKGLKIGRRDCKRIGLCSTKNHSGIYENGKCRDCQGRGLCWKKIHSGYKGLKIWCRDCKGTSVCWIEGHSGYENLKITCIECQAFCWTKGQSGYETKRARFFGNSYSLETAVPPKADALHAWVKRAFRIREKISKCQDCKNRRRRTRCTRGV